MKQCPQCTASLRDEVVVCHSCWSIVSGSLARPRRRRRTPLVVMGLLAIALLYVAC